MRITEYAVEHLEDVLILRRTKGYVLWGLVGVMFPMVGIVIMGREYALHPVDKIDLLLSSTVVCGMAFVFYKLLIWGNRLVFDKKNNQFLIDGRKVCALSDLACVQIEGSDRSPRIPKMGKLRVLHLKTAQGRDITLKTAWEGSPEYRSMTELERVISAFSGAKSNVA